jgi:two-component system cell cycle sensor histidine kinase/response regulator CckA
MAELLRASVPKRIALVTELAQDLSEIEGDHGQLEQVVTNLLVNAVEAIGECTGQITLSTTTVELAQDDIERAFPGQDLTPARYVRLRMEDTGGGMSPETLRRIFEPFFSQKGMGRGLGLAAMRGVIRAHRGGVSVESELGKGTCFTIVFPVLESPVTQDQPQESSTRVSAGSTVLVVDDEFEVRDVVKDMLVARGLQVLTAEDGTRGVEVFRRHADSIDVVLLDMAMPGKSGDAVLQEMLAIRPDAKVIVSSGFIEESDAEQFGSAKPAGFLHKPFTTDALMERIGDVLERPLSFQGQTDARLRPKLTAED